MPELPDIEVYVEKLCERVCNQTLQQVRIAAPFLLRSVEPALTVANGRRVTGLQRIGKRIAIGLEGDYWLILHLMVAGRLHWHDSKPSSSGRSRLAIFDFSSGSLSLTEAGSKKRASLHFVQGEKALRSHDPGGIEPLSCSFDEFANGLGRRNRTLKRALTDPAGFSGIGNAYSDEILHAARLSPILHTQRLSDADRRNLFDATRHVLGTWRQRLMTESAHEFPDKVTAFRQGMAVHGRFGKPCPVCGTAVARIRYKSNETNYCPRCQTDGRLLADRSLSRLLKADWPGRIEDD
jgi:formamidopyrimidine-DNA glycosylase